MATVEDNKQAVRRLFEAFDAADGRAMDELLTPDFVAHGVPPGYAENADGWKQLASDIKNAFPDTREEIEDLIAEGDKVAARFTSRGTHKGEIFGLAPSGRTVTVSGIEIYLLSGGKVAEYWGEFNMSELFGPPPQTT